MAEPSPRTILSRQVQALKRQLAKGEITRDQYNKRYAAASRKFESSSGLARKIGAEGRAAAKAGTEREAAALKASVDARDTAALRADIRTNTATRLAAQKERAAFEKAAIQKALKVGKFAKFARISGPLAYTTATADVAKAMGYKRENTKASREAYAKNKAAGLPGSMAETYGQKIKSNALKNVGKTAPRVGRPSAPASKPTAARTASKPAVSSTSTKPTTKSSQNGSVGVSGASTHVVKRGDTLWDIAQKNNTTVSALLKANPVIAKRKEAGKVTIFSGSKVRIPKGK